MQTSTLVKHEERVQAVLDILATPADVRVANGARWLDENFPGWVDRIDLETLDLSQGERCICGQVFKQQGKKLKDVGYGFANKTLFSEANSWINGIVLMETLPGMEVIENEEGYTELIYQHHMTPTELNEFEDRTALVAIALGFMTWSTRCLRGLTDVRIDRVDDEIWFHHLQAAWVELLLDRGAS